MVRKSGIYRSFFGESMRFLAKVINCARENAGKTSMAGLKPGAYTTKIRVVGWQVCKRVSRATLKYRTLEIMM